MHTHKRSRGLLLGLFICFCGDAFAQTTPTSGIPVFRSEEEKIQWIKEHPEEYQNAGGGVAATTQQSSIPEFSTPEAKAEWLAKNSQKSDSSAAGSVQVTKSKSTEIESQPQVSGAVGNSTVVAQSAMPDDPTFPVMKNTGDPERDAADYELRKQEWYSLHPAKIFVSRAEYMALPVDKQNKMRENPAFVIEQ